MHNNEIRFYDENKEISGKKNSSESPSAKEAVFYAENAKTTFDVIRELRKKAGVDGKMDKVQQELEYLAPRTLFRDQPKDWMSKGFPDDISSLIAGDSLPTPLSVGQRLRIAKYRPVAAYTSRREGGVEGYPVFSTYSETQMAKMADMQKKVGLRVSNISRQFNTFLNNPILYHKRYESVREQVWANYMAFSEFDNLSRLRIEAGIEIRNLFYKDKNVRDYVTKCFINELRVIDSWLFKKDPIKLALDPKDSKKLIKQILRGNAIKNFIFVSQPRSFRSPEPVEFSMGLFRFPLAGFGRATEPSQYIDINDLAGLSIWVLEGILSYTGFTEIVEKLIDSVTGAESVVPEWRMPPDLLVQDYFMETKNVADLKNFLKIQEHFSKKLSGLGLNDECMRDRIKCLSDMTNPQEICKEIDFTSFYGLAWELKKSKSPKNKNSEGVT